jgi:hypothetical protein
MTRSRALLAVALLVFAVLLASAAGARVEGNSEYSKAQTFSGALRYLRVDLGYEVVEKDADSAYLVFKYVPPGQPKGEAIGTVEVIEASEHVRVFVRIPRMPEYHERILRDGLLRKLREEYGTPAPRKPDRPDKPDKPDKPDPKQPTNDAGAG